MTPYGHHWRTRTRPAILERDGNRCARCFWGSGPLDIAHLDGDNTHEDHARLAALCRTCHRRLDYASWSSKSKLTRCVRKDAGRPLLSPGDILAGHALCGLSSGVAVVGLPELG